MSQRHMVIDGHITGISEAFTIVRYRYFKLRFFYPIISYEYVINGTTHAGSCGKESSRRYRISELNGWGDVRGDDAFFWRNLSVGGRVPVLVDLRGPGKSRLAIAPTREYLSERWAIGIGVSLVLLALIGIAVLRIA